MPPERLKLRVQFLRVAGQGQRFVTPGLILQMLERPDLPAGSERRPVAPEAVRYGITASKRVGNAVVRNRVRRRLRALAEALLPLHGRPGCDYVLVGRAATAGRPHPALVDDLIRALAGVAGAAGRGGRRQGGPRRRPGNTRE